MQMENRVIPTEFAPAERENLKIVELQSNAFARNLLLYKMVNAVSEMLIVLNGKRQIIFANDAFISEIGIKEEKNMKLNRLKF